MILLWGLIGFLTGRGLSSTGLPDSVKQERYDAREARRQARHASGTPATGQWIVVILFVLFVVGLIMQAFQ